MRESLLAMLNESNITKEGYPLELNHPDDYGYYVIAKALAALWRDEKHAVERVQEIKENLKNREEEVKTIRARQDSLEELFTQLHTAKLKREESEKK